VYWNPSALMTLLEIVSINLVMSGDNAVVVAMAVHRLPTPQRRAAVLYGMLGAIGVHVGATLAIVRMLEVPLLLAAGGVALTWIALQLRHPDEAAAPEIQAPPSLTRAVRTILVADLIMSADNMLAVASVGQEHPVLIVFGLVFSITLVMTGSLFLSTLMQRYPMLVTAGAGVLAWTGGHMIAGDPLMQRTVWARFGAHLMEGPFRIVLAACLTTLVVSAPQWRRWKVRTAAR